ncbi:MAG: hypothetical protein ACR2K2_11605, partial [Mycobacteriales bacterium]
PAADGPEDDVADAAEDDVPEVEDVADVPEVEDVADVPEVEDGVEEAKREPAPKASFGQSVADDARKGGVNGQDIAEQARQRGIDRRGAAGQPAERPEQATTGSERSKAGAGNSDAGRETAANAPVEDAPAGTPAEGQARGRR